MSFPLATVDLSTAAVGTKGTISLNNVGISAGGVSNNPATLNKPATLFFFNDSGCGLQISFSQSGSGFNLPAGAWVPVPLPPGENKIGYVVLYVLPSPPVSLLLLTYYDAGESIPQSMTLGNSPVGIGGSVTTSSVQTLSNETATLGTKIVDIGTLTINDLIDIFNDHFLMKVQQSGVAHQVLAGNTAGNPLQIGQAGDITEVLGKLTVDQTTILTGVLTAAAANLFGAIGVLTHILGTLTVDQTALITGILTLTAQPQLTAKQIGDGSGNNLVDWAAAGIFLKGNPANIAGFHYQGDGANTDFQLSAISKFTGTGNGTFAHGLKQAGVATTPDIIIAVQNVLGSQTFGYSSLGATNVTIATGAGNSWVALAIKL